MMDEVLLLCSGGLDSTTLAYWLRSKGHSSGRFSSTTDNTALKRSGPPSVRVGTQTINELVERRLS
jgi:hypothetical protein